MTNFCLFDVSNLIYRIALAGGSAPRTTHYDDPEDQVNLALATAIRSMRIPYDRFASDHSVMCFDHASWRKTEFAGYKAGRANRTTGSEAAVFEGINRVIDEFRKFLIENTNCTVLWRRGCEADDLIARFIALHPSDHCTIVSSDSDFKQLISENVSLYNATTSTLMRLDGIFRNDGKKLKRGASTVMIGNEEWEIVEDKNGIPEKVDPKWFLFRKIMDGDKSDDIPRSSPPRTKTKLLEEIYKHWGGAAWSDMMATKRTDVEGSPTVAELYDRHSKLIDLSRIPDHVVDDADYHIAEQIAGESKRGLGMKFMIFCRDRRMINLGNEAERYAPMLSAPYPL